MGGGVRGWRSAGWMWEKGRRVTALICMVIACTSCGKVLSAAMHPFHPPAGGSGPAAAMCPHTLQWNSVPAERMICAYAHTLG